MYMYFSKSLQGSKSAITMRPVSIESILLLLLQARNQIFFRAGEVSWNSGTSINISSKTQEKKAPQRKILNFFLLDTLKTAF